MLHYIVSPYVCNVALEVFSCSWDRGRAGERGDRGVSGFRSIPAAGAGGFGKRGAVFRSIPAGQGGEGSGVPFAFYSRGEGGLGGRSAKSLAFERVSRPDVWALGRPIY